MRRQPGSIKTLAEAEHHRAYAHFVLIISFSVQRRAAINFLCLNAEELRVRYVARIYHVYVRYGVGNARSILIRNVPFVRLFRSKDGDLRNKTCVLRKPMFSRGTSSGDESDGVFAWLPKDRLNLPLNNIGRRTLAGLTSRNACIRMILTT